SSRRPSSSRSPVASSIRRPSVTTQVLAPHSRFARQRHRVERSPGKCGFRACRTRSTSPLCHPWRKRLAVAILPKETGDGNLSRPPSRRRRTQPGLVPPPPAVLPLTPAALTPVSAAPTASACIGSTGGCSAHRPALGRALGGRDVLALRGLGLRLSLLLALIAL